MRLSLKAIELCRTKFGKGEFCGFEQNEESVIDPMLQEVTSRDFDELTQNGIIDITDDNIHISALGQHIFYMMLEPEQYIMLDNEADNKRVRIYIRNTYYLCVIEDKKVKSKDEYNRYIFKLLPKLDLVVGAFVHALHRKDNYASLKNDNDNIKQDISIIGKAWNTERNEISQITIQGNYENGAIHYQMIEEIEGVESKPKNFETETSELVNMLTKWTFDKISAMNESEVD